MCARTFKCEACFEEYAVERCCDIGGSPCEEFKSLLDDRGIYAPSIMGSDDEGCIDPCRYCGSYINNPASFADTLCLGWKANKEVA